ncbi:MAG: trimeric intracellular cation channel family protein [Haloferacaceae archaeon]
MPPVTLPAAVPSLDPFALMNAVGLVAFAVVGALKAAEADLDLFGVAVLGVLTALGGGVTRDVLVGRVPAALQSTTDVGVVLAGVALAVSLRRWHPRRLRDHTVLLLADAVGLAAFAATGALVGVDAGLSAFGVVTLAALTGVGGGSISDVLLGRVPVVLREDFYATPAVVGGVAFWGAVRLGVAPRTAVLPCAALVFALRSLALRYEWRLPTV